MRATKLSALSLFAACLLTANAQSYTPKQIRLQGAEGSDQAELMRLIALKPGVPTNKTEIEAALQRLADTGSFTDLSYTVDANTLTFILKPAEGSQALPAYFSNFAWWKPGELEPLVEARVPLFHGKLPLTGQLTAQVCEALVALLAEKGVADAKVTPSLSTSSGGGGNGNKVSAISLSIERPHVILGDIKLTGAAPAVERQLSVVTSKLAGQEFDSAESAAAIRNNVSDTHLNGGFLDAVVDQPVFAEPHKDTFNYEVDATVTVRPGELYHIETLDLQPPPPVTAADAEQATGLHVGDPAGAMNLAIAQGSLTKAYAGHGYLEAHVLAISNRNTTKHTVADRFSINAGVLDHLARVDTSGLSPELQKQFASAWPGEPGMAAGVELNTGVFRALRAMGATKTVRVNQVLDRTRHTVTLVLVPVNNPAVDR